MGGCKGVVPNGSLTCESCKALIRGKTSSLNRKLHRSKSLKHPRSEDTRATASGVSHKYCSAQHLQLSVQIRKTQLHISSEKVSSLMTKNEALLHDSWHSHSTAKPFMQTLLKLFEFNKLTEFDMNILSNWLEKKSNGRFYKADQQAKRLAILFSNKLGGKMYTTTAPLLGLPTFRQAKKICARDLIDDYYMSGVNKWPLQRLASRELIRPLQNGMDGTRVIRALD